VFTNDLMPLHSGTALFLLLAFRTNSCYDRWWDGRRLWGNMGIRCLDLARVASTWVARRDKRAATRLVRLAMATSVVFNRWLRRETEVG
jgi:predicted membrane chloride channel (bestrophin family)